MATLRVRYLPPDQQNAEERHLGVGELLVIGRSPGPDGLQLVDADSGIGRGAVTLELRHDGVRITNAMRWLPVQYGPQGLAPRDLAPREAATISENGSLSIVSEAEHLIGFEIDGPLDQVDQDFAAWGSVTSGGHEQTVFNQLDTRRQQTCHALVVAWFIFDFRDIPPRTPTGNQYVGIALEVTRSAADNKIERTTRDLGNWLCNEDRDYDHRPCRHDHEFVGVRGKDQLCQWLILHRLVTSDEIDALPGLDDLVRY